MRVHVTCSITISLLLVTAGLTLARDEKSPGPAALSEETQACIECHKNVTPGIVEDWLISRHAKTTPAEGLSKTVLERRISNDDVPASLRAFAVGCFECHSQHPAGHKDNFDHFGYKINVVVSPNDCSVCHPAEANQYAESKKAHALGNLKNNPVYHTLVEAIDGVQTFEGGTIQRRVASESTKHETCFACHGTAVEVKGTKSVATAVGDVEVPNLTNWPNQGVGRINPDVSMGTCTACHTRHSFLIEIARKPATCGQCHLEPDVPGWDVYKESKHGNIVLSREHEQNWDDVPWKVGKDFQAPTCATCHNSLMASPEGEVLVQRTHDFGARLWVRIFGLITSHPQPKSGNTSIIKNADGLPLPTTFTGQPASTFLIDAGEQERRQTEMRKVCQGCHGTSWTNGHFAKFEQSIAEADSMVLAATKLVQQAWDSKLADPANPFDESIEQLWTAEWLFYANSVRYGSAMGGPDYATFERGWWDLTHNLAEMHERLARHAAIQE